MPYIDLQGLRYLLRRLARPLYRLAPGLKPAAITTAERKRALQRELRAKGLSRSNALKLVANQFKKD